VPAADTFPGSSKRPGECTRQASEGNIRAVACMLAGMMPIARAVKDPGKGVGEIVWSSTARDALPKLHAQRAERPCGALSVAQLSGMGIYSSMSALPVEHKGCRPRVPAGRSLIERHLNMSKLKSNSKSGNANLHDAEESEASRKGQTAPSKVWIPASRPRRQSESLRRAS
jgi:hypothetical protein